MKMLKHLFGKRDKELDVLQEEALQSPLRTVVRNFTSNRLAFGGLIVFLVIFLIVLIGPVFNPIDLSEKEETQINVAPGLNMMKVPDGLKGNVKEISTGATFSVGVGNKRAGKNRNGTSVRQYIPSGSCSNSEPESNIESLWIGCE